MRDFLFFRIGNHGMMKEFLRKIVKDRINTGNGNQSQCGRKSQSPDDRQGHGFQKWIPAADAISDRNQSADRRCGSHEDGTQPDFPASMMNRAVPFPAGAGC